MPNSTHKEPSLMGRSFPIAGLFCLIGFFLHIVLSDPLLNSLGFHYSEMQGHWYEKIHPGSVFVFISFIILIFSTRDPFRHAYVIYKEHTVFCLLLLLYAALLAYMVLRDGPQGLAFIIDGHMTVPLCAIVLCYTPLSYCRTAVHIFIGIAVANSLIGIAEATYKFRLFTFDPDWVVLHEQYFRASALRGHPLNNAMFTAVALFVAMSLRYHWLLKTLLAAVFMVSLVAFGGRVALAFSALGIVAIVWMAIKKQCFEETTTLLRIWLGLIAGLALPLCLAAGLGLAIESGMGERIASHLQWDTSAESRKLAFLVFHYMSNTEILFGVSSQRVVDISYRMKLGMGLSDIENPWILMCMHLGAVAFCLWLAATLAFVYTLIKNRPSALQLAVIAYFAIATTSNSFGRKDSTYLIMVTAVLCAVRSLYPPQRESLC